MRAVTKVAILVTLTALAGTARLEAQFGRPSAPGLTVWVDADFRGANHTFLSDTPDISSTGLGRQISSLRPGPGETWQACSEPNYGGRCRVFSAGVSNLQDIAWNDLILSVRRVGGRDTGPGGRPLPPVTAFELYAGTQYSGEKIVLREATPDFRRRDFNDRALSLRVPRGETWEVCVNTGYDDCRVVTEDVPDLSTIGLNRLISSARPRATGRGRGPSLPATPQIVLYDAANFTGRNVSIDSDQRSLSLFNNQAGSVQVLAGRWELCDRPGYEGTCLTTTESIRDLGRSSLRGRVASVRRR